MRRQPLMLPMAAIVLVGVLGIAAAGAQASGSLANVTRAQNSALGAILVSADGRTLYHESSEGKNVVKCTGPCASIWPPLLLAAAAKPVAGPGVRASLLGTVKRPDGKLQIAYDGKPLYRYTGDSKAGQVNGQGAGGIWHAIAPSGSIVVKAMNTSAGANTGKTSPSSGPSSSPSYGSSGSGSSGSGSSNTGSGSSSSNAAICAADPMDCYNGVPIPAG